MGVESFVLRPPLWIAVGHWVTSAIYSTTSGWSLWGQSYVPLASACQCALSCLPPSLAVLSLSRKPTSLLEPCTSLFLPTLLVLSAFCLTYSAAAASKGQQQHLDLSLGTFCPPCCSEKLGHLFLQASGSPVHPGHFSVHKHFRSLPGTFLTCLTLTNSKRRTK